MFAIRSRRKVATEKDFLQAVEKVRRAFDPLFSAPTHSDTSPLSRRSFALAASSPVRDCTRSTNDLACDDAYALPSSRVTVRESISAVRVEKSLSHASRKSGFLLSHVTAATSYFCTSRFAARESSRSARVANTCRERFRILPISVQPVPSSRNLTSASSKKSLACGRPRVCTVRFERGKKSGYTVSAFLAWCVRLYPFFPPPSMSSANAFHRTEKSRPCRPLAR